MVDPIVALSAVGTVLKIVDSLTGQWDRFLKRAEQEDVPHRVSVEQTEPGTIVVREHGRRVDTITAADVAKLDENSRKLIEAMERSMQRQYELWTKIYPTRDQSSDPIVNAQVEQRLAEILNRMCGDMGLLFGYLESIGKQLDDHYSHARYLCREVKRKTP